MRRRPVHVRADDKPSGEQIPPLEPGDRLTRDEFERPYAAMPRGIKAELLAGVVHMSSPTRSRRHGRDIEATLPQIAGWADALQAQARQQW